MKIESKIGTIAKPQSEIYELISKLNNLDKYIPSEKVQNWQSTENSCSFSVPNVGEINLEIVNREPVKTIKFSGGTVNQPMNFHFWIQLKEVAINDTKVKLTIDLEIPAMMKMMVKKPIQEALNSLVDQLPRMFANI